MGDTEQDIRAAHAAAAAELAGLRAKVAGLERERDEARAAALAAIRNMDFAPVSHDALRGDAVRIALAERDAERAAFVLSLVAGGLSAYATDYPAAVSSIRRGIALLSDSVRDEAAALRALAGAAAGDA